MSTRNLVLLKQALGATLERPNGHRNHLRATAGSEDGHICAQLTECGFMARGSESIPASEFEDFVVTERGADFVRRELMDEIVTNLLGDHVSEAASLRASELEGCNSIEYDSLCEKLEEDPKVIADATDALMRRLFGLCAELKTQLQSATQLASNWMPDEFQNEDDRMNYVQTLTEHTQALQQANQLMGDCAWLGRNACVDEFSTNGEADDFESVGNGDAPDL